MEISVNNVLAGIERIEERLPEKLETEVVVID
jgi:hypothetical protein